MSVISNKSSAEVSYRRPLNSEQLDILRLLYRFRFGSSELIAKYVGKTNVKLVQKKLKVLEDQGFVGKHYDKSYRLQGKPAAYYLLPKGARLLKARLPEEKTITDQGIKALYRNKTASAEFIAHCHSIFKIALHCKVLYGDKLKLFTGIQLATQAYFPAWHPDIYAALQRGTDQANNKRFFLDILDGTKPFFVSVRKVRNYLKFSEEGDWPENRDFPTILTICDTQKNEKKLRRQIRRALEESYEEPTFATTTMETFLAATTSKAKVWSDVTEPEDLVNLAGT